MNMALTGLVMWLAIVDLPIGTELKYAGTLNQQTPSGVVEAKSFTIDVISLNDDDGNLQWVYHVEERGGGWGWPERVGMIPNPKSPAIRSRLMGILLAHEGQQYPVAIRSPLFEFQEKLVPQAAWSDGRRDYVVTRPRKIMNRDCFQIDVSSNLGRSQTLVVEAISGIVISLDERVFVGRGVEFQLKLELQSQTQLADGDLAKNRQVWDSLLAIQTRLNRTGEQKVLELTSDQVSRLRQDLPRIEKEAEGTSWSRIVASIARDLQQQQKRLDGVAGLEKKLVGQAAPKWMLKRTDGTMVTDETFKDQVVVLHFWQYRGEPLSEPYGQIGYLDFLYSKRKKLGLAVVGVNVDERFANPQQAGAATRSMKSLLEFMKIGYEMTMDDGSVLAEFGDPRAQAAPLPLWIVIGHDGRVAHVHTGFYSIKPDEGLKLLDDAVVEALRHQKAQ